MISSVKSGLRYGGPCSSVTTTISPFLSLLRTAFAAAIPAGPHPRIKYFMSYLLEVSRSSLPVPLLVELPHFLPLFLADPLLPLVLVLGEDEGGGTREELLGLRQEFVVEPVRHFEGTVPLRVVRSHHRSPVPRASPLVVPHEEVGPLDLAGEGVRRDLPGFRELLHQFPGGLGELLVVMVDGDVELGIEGSDEPL